MNKEKYEALLDVIKENAATKEVENAIDFLKFTMESKVDFRDYDESEYPRLREICSEFGMELTPKELVDCVKISNYANEMLDRLEK